MLLRPEILIVMANASRDPEAVKKEEEKITTERERMDSAEREKLR